MATDRERADAKPADHTAPFNRAIAPERLGKRARLIAIDETATATELAALRDAFALEAANALRIAGELTPVGAEGWRFDGELRAHVTQNCVKTLAPLDVEIVELVSREWRPKSDLAAVEKKDVIVLAGAGTDDAAQDPDPLEDGVDLGLVAVETLALALDPYPEAPDAAFSGVIAGPPGVAPLTDEDARPFAGLAALKTGSAQAASSPADGADAPEKALGNELGASSDPAAKK